MIKLLHIIKKRLGLLIIIVPLVLLVIYYSLTAFIGQKSPKNVPGPSSLNPTAAKPTMAPDKTQTNPPVKYNGNSSIKMLERLKKRIPLSVKDEATKQRIITSINGKSTILRTTATFRVEYIKSPDVFLVEVKTIDIGKGKVDARSWFISQGFTPQGACELPVVYYLNSEVASQLRDLGITFSPLADGC